GGDVVLSALKDLTDSAAQDVLRHRSGPPMRCFGKELVLTHPFLEATGFSGSPTYSAAHTTIGYQSLVIVGNGSSNVNHYGGSIWPSTDLSDPNDATALHPRLRFRFRIH